MIEILPQSAADRLVVHFSGKVTGSEYKHFLDVLGERMKTGNRINLVVEFAGFEFYGDIDAAKQDLKFGFADYKHIHRAAFVGNQQWLDWFTRLISPFTKTEEKYFPEGEIEAAFQWANV